MNTLNDGENLLSRFRGVFKGVTIPRFYVKLGSKLQTRMVLEWLDLSASQMSSV